MSKRKREEDIDSEIKKIEDQAVRIKVSRLKVRFDNGVQQLTAQLRLARGFDRQKMTRRIKQAGSDKSKLERLGAEVQVLKDINERKIARNYLLKQCVRTKRIAETEAFRSLFGGYKIKPSGSVAEGNVLGRLFKSNPVSEALPAIMKSFREVVGADKPNTAATHENMGLGSNDTKPPKLVTTLVDEDGAESEFEGFSEHNDEAIPESLVSELLEAYDARLVASSDDESKNGKEIDVRGQNHDRDQDSMEITSDDDNGVDGEEVSIPSDSEDELEPSQRNSSLSKTARSLNASTSFLPSLMHGGYYSGSESGEDDTPDGYDPDKAYAAATPQPRKNRRGQRARQAIAEKKHGAKALHVVKANGADGVHGDRQRFITTSKTDARGKVRNDGWDARRGAIEAPRGRGAKNSNSSEGPNRSERRNGVSKSYDKSTSRNLGLFGTKARVGKKEPAVKQEKLHPSWEAAKKKKIATGTAGEGSFAGKKITFD